MKLNDEIDLSGIFPALAESGIESEGFVCALNKFSGLVIYMVEEAARDGIFEVFKNAKVLIGNSEGCSQEVVFSALSRNNSGSSVPSARRLDDEEAVQLVASDVTSRAVQDIQHLKAQNEREKLKRIEADLPTYLQTKYFQKIMDGKLPVANIRYTYPHISNSYEEERKNDEDGDGGCLSYTKLMAALSLFGRKEAPSDIIFSEKINDFLDRIVKAVSIAIKKLRENSVDSFNYLVALIEGALLAKDRQREKAPSKKTAEVQRDMCAILINPLLEAGLYDAERYKLVFSEGYDPYKSVGCSGAGATIKKRSIYKKSLLEVFRPLLKAELQDVFSNAKAELSGLSKIARSGGKKNRNSQEQTFLMDIADIVDAVCGWVESIGYKKISFEKAEL